MRDISYHETARCKRLIRQLTIYANDQKYSRPLTSDISSTRIFVEYIINLEIGISEWGYKRSLLFI